MILVCGLDYSGTSMVAGLLSHLGIDMGTFAPHPPPVDDLEQAVCLAAGGHARTWPTYEDDGVRRACAAGVTQGPASLTEYEAEIWAALHTYAALHPEESGLKTNFACLLRGLPACVHTLIMTRREERERRERERYYLGTLRTDPQLRRLYNHMHVGYALLRRHADLVIDFRDLYEDPWGVIWALIRVTGIHPSAHQQDTARNSIRGRETTWPLELHHS